MGASGETASAVAIACAEAGADVAVTSATQDADEAFAIRRLAKRISDLDRRSIAEAVDLSLGTNVQVAVRQIAKQLGGIDVLVVAADVRVVKPAERLSDSEWARVLNGNLSAVFYACRAAAREMLSKEDATDRGRIVVLLPGVEEETSAAYAAARAGISWA